jgi:hypothetical protein
MKILKALIYAKEDQLPLFDGSTKKRVNLLDLQYYFSVKIDFSRENNWRLIKGFGTHRLALIR